MSADRTPPSSPRRLNGPAGARTQRGFSLIELMVGLVVSLIVGLAATTSAVVFTASQRQSLGVGGMSVNITTALAALKNEASTAGLGFFGDSRFLCSKLNLGIGTVAHWDGTTFAPVRITRTAGQDRVDILQASRVESGATVMLAVSSTGANAYLKSLLPTAVGDAVLMSPKTSGDPCLLRTVTAVTPSTEDTRQILTFAGGGTHNDATFTTNPSYSDDGGGVTQLGQLRWQRYRLDGTNLVLEQPLTGTSAIVARNVVGFRVQYGVSSGTDLTSKTLKDWVDATGTFASLDDTNIGRVRAVRVGVVTRSTVREKANAGGTCEATDAASLPKLFGTAVTSDVSDWQCFRYRSAVVVIPLRNLVIGIKA
jgi:type IV pilus assembly protein PilW